MTDIDALAALWLAVAATILSIWLRIATAMSEIVVGTAAQLAIGAAVGGAALGTDQSRIKFLASTGAIILTSRGSASKAGVPAMFAVMVGHPPEQIVHYAENHDVDHIVLRHRGKSFFRRWLLGSVSKQVIHYAHCTATVVR